MKNWNFTLLNALIFSMLQAAQGSTVYSKKAIPAETRKSLNDSLIKDQNRKKVKLNKDLAAILDTILSDDQTYRKKIQSIEKEYGATSVEYTALMDSIRFKDEINLKKVESILDKYGWLSKAEIGARGPLTLFLVIQHATLPVQVKYLPMMKAAVKAGNAAPQNLALLEDRIALGQGKRQIYGSQIGRSTETGVSYVLPLEDPLNVDKRRAEVGLPPLKEYVSQWGIDWNAETYVEHLPEKRLIIAPSISTYKKPQKSIPFSNKASTN